MSSNLWMNWRSTKSKSGHFLTRQPSLWQMKQSQLNFRTMLSLTISWTPSRIPLTKEKMMLYLTYHESSVASIPFWRKMKTTKTSSMILKFPTKWCIWPTRRSWFWTRKLKKTRKWKWSSSSNIKKNVSSKKSKIPKKRREMTTSHQVMKNLEQSWHKHHRWSKLDLWWRRCKKSRPW